MFNLSNSFSLKSLVSLCTLIGCSFLLSVQFALADSQTIKIYSSPGDGDVSTSPYPGTWINQHDDTTGRLVSPDDEIIRVQTAAFYTPADFLAIARGYLAFDLSALPEETNIESVELVLYATNKLDDFNDEYGYIAVSEGFQSSTETLTGSDIANCVDSNGNINLLSNKVDITGMAIDSFQSFSIDNTDGSLFADKFIKFCIREGHDLENQEVQSFVSGNWSESRIYFASSENPDLEKRPYLEITYTTSEDEEEEADRADLYTQIQSPYPSETETASWASDAYAAGKKYACGSTIGACGCVITSLVMMAVTHGIESGVDGEVINPKNLDDWLTANDGYTENGSIKWAKGLEYFGARNNDGEIETPFSLQKHNETNMSSIQTAAAAASTNVMAFSTRVGGGHYFLIDDYDSGSYTVRDPWYYDTLTLDDIKESEDTYVFDYNNQVAKANLFAVEEPKVISGFVDITLASPAELVLRDTQGRVTGWDDGVVVTNVPNASYDREEFIGNPAWEESPMDPHYIKRMIVTQATDKYELDVTGTATGTYTVSIDLYDGAGRNTSVEFTAETAPGQVDQYLLDLTTASVEPIESDGLDRAVFIAIVEAAIADEHPRTQRYMLRFANKIFDQYEKGKLRQAEVKLRIFKKIVRWSRIKDADLNDAMKTLKQQIRDERKNR